MMDTPVAVKPGRTAFRHNIRPRIIKNQHELSSLIPTPAARPVSRDHSATTRNNESTFRTPGGPPISSSSSSRMLKPSDAASASLFSVLDRSGWSVRVEHAVNEIIREHSARQQDTSIYGDTNRMFNATLDAVIIIANAVGGCTGGGGKVDISDEHLLWSEGFLRGVRDRYGNHPPNVRKLLGFIRHLWDEKVAKGTAGAADASQLFQQTYQENAGNVTTRIPPPTPTV
uniref:Uncharacterized protein n=2 Tax=Culex tarsalis TaxID=7177 RepID=A0A1Q3G080_CULTA